MAHQPTAALALDRVRRLAQQDQVEVEHLLAFAQIGDPSVVPVLQAFKALYGWPQRGRIPGSTNRFVPLGRWTDYICAFLQGGCERIVELALDAEEHALERDDGLVVGGLALGLLSGIRSPEAAASALKIGCELQDLPGSEPTIRGALTALNQLVSLEPRVAIEPVQAALTREWVHIVLRLNLEPATVAVGYCVLREVGDESSVELIRGRPPLSDPWSGLERQVVRRIRERSR